MKQSPYSTPIHNLMPPQALPQCSFDFPLYRISPLPHILSFPHHISYSLPAQNRSIYTHIPSAHIVSKHFQHNLQKLFQPFSRLFFQPVLSIHSFTQQIYKSRLPLIVIIFSSTTSTGTPFATFISMLALLHRNSKICLHPS